LIDFTASWCGACGELDRETFSHPSVVRESRRFVCVRVDLSPSQNTPAKQALLAGYRQPGLPLVVLHGSRGREAARVTSKVDPDEMLKIMRRVR
jgi:thiol:disulfide interchange protein DsbD